MTLAQLIAAAPRRGLHRRLPAGSLRITDIDVVPAARLRVREMGLRVGQVIRIAQRGAFGGLVLAICTSRVAIDRATAQHISVEEIQP